MLSPTRRRLPLLWLALLLVVAGVVPAAWASQELPTSLPSTLTTNVVYNSDSYTGTIPTQYGLLTNLQRLLLQSNELTGPVPTELGNLAKLKVACNVEFNSLSFTLPTQLGRLTALTSTFSLEYNYFTGRIPTQFGQLEALQTTFDVSSNQLTSEVPTELGELSNLLLRLYTQNNQLTGRIPTELALLTSMTYHLYFFDNSLTGQVPSQMGQLSALSVGFDFEKNNLNSTIPTQMGKLTSLQSRFFLRYNDLFGSIPTEMGNLLLMRSDFHLEHASLNGTLPTEFGRWESFGDEFNVQHNSLLQAVPTELGLLTLMTEEFNLGSNKLTSLPTELGAFSLLTYGFAIDSNRFTHMPTELGELLRLTEYFVAGAALASWGPMPTQLGRLTLLTTTLVLNENSFTSSAPSQLGQLSSLSSGLLLGSNSLSALPTELGLLTALTQYLWADSNLLTVVPTELGRLTSLVDSLGLQSNLLSGTIASQLGALASLETGFYLSDNSLSGSIPSQLGALIDVDSNFWLHNNSLCDDLPTQVVRLSSLVASGWSVSNGNYLGTDCCNVFADSFTCNPTVSPTHLPTPFCAKGEYYDGASAGCTACPAGTYRNSTDVPSDCTTCPLGKYRTYSSDPSNALTCEECPSGTHLGRPCLCRSDPLLATGRVSASDFASCETCDSGEYALNETQCATCPSGRYAPTAQEAQCLECPEGSYTGVASGATTCSSCEAGKYSTRLSVRCSACPAGKSSSARASSCDECEAGKFASANASSDCDKCSSEVGLAYSSFEGATVCDKCLEDYFLYPLQDEQCDDGEAWCSSAAGECRECPDDGVDCSGSGAVLGALDVDEGWYRFTNESSHVYKCPYFFNCRGGNSTADEQRCSAGSEGPLCAVCSDGYLLESEQCRSCDSVGASASVFGLVFFVLGALALAGFYRCKKAWNQIKQEGPDVSTDPTEWEPATELEPAPMLGRAEQHSTYSIGSFKIASQDVDDASREVALVGAQLSVFVTCVQTLLLLQGNFSSAGGSDPPKFWSAYLKVFDCLDLNLLAFMPGLGCVVSGYVFTVLFQTLTFLAILAAGVVLYYYRRRRGQPEAWHVFKDLATVSHFLLPVVSSTIAKGFRCEHYDDGEFTYLLADLSLDCTSSRYQAVLVYVSVMVAVFPVGMLLFAALELLSIKRHIVTSDGNYGAHPVLRKSFLLPLFDGLHPEYAYWFDVYDMTRRLALTTATLLFHSVGPFILFAVFVSFLSAVIHEHCQPYQEEIFNRLDSGQHWQSILAMTVMLMQQSPVFDGSLGLVAAFLLLTNVAMCGVIFGRPLIDRLCRPKQVNIDAGDAGQGVELTAVGEAAAEEDEAEQASLVDPLPATETAEMLRAPTLKLSGLDEPSPAVEGEGQVVSLGGLDEPAPALMVQGAVVIQDVELAL